MDVEIRHRDFVKEHLDYPNPAIDIGDILRLNLAMLDRIADLEDQLKD